MSQQGLDTRPDWYKHAVFYELYIRAFADGNGDGHGDLQGLLEKVDYLAELGVDCVWLLPYYPSPLRDDGYDISDFYNIHEQYGTTEQLRQVIDALHERGIRVIADLVMNHTSDEHPWFKESRSSRDNPKRDWYVWSDTDELYKWYVVDEEQGLYKQTRIIFQDTETSNWTYDEHTGQYYWHRFYSSQPDLNFENPEVQQEMLHIADFWMELGLDGFRADAIPYLFEEDGTNGENHPNTHIYLKTLRNHIDVNWAGRILLAEANQPPAETREYLDEDEFHMGFHFPLMPRLYMGLKDADRTKIVEIMNATPEIPDAAQWCMFLRNHDELTLEMVTLEERHEMWDFYAPDPEMRMNVGIRRRLAPLLDNDRRRIELLNAVIFSMPGTPIIYYGDELGMGDNIELFDRNGVRTPMQWHAGHNAGFSEADSESLYAPVINDVVYGYQRINVENQRNEEASLFKFMQNLIQVRKQLPIFGVGTFEFVLPENKTILSYWRAYEGEKVLTLFNFSDEEQEVSLLLGLFDGHTPQDLLSDTEFETIRGKHYDLTLEPYAYHWLKV